MNSNRTLLLAALLAVLFAATACQREQAPAETAEAKAAAETTEAAPEPATIPGTDAISAVENTTAEAGVQPVEETVAGMDPRSFAGRFTAEGATLELAGDGSYTMTVRAESAGADLQGTGTWSVEDDGKRILLDPNSKSEDDRSYSVVSSDELEADAGGQLLRRDGAQ